MVPLILFFGRLFEPRKSPDVRFMTGRFITQVWTNREGGGPPIDRVSFRRPFRRGSTNEFWHDELDDLSLAVRQAYDWTGYGIRPVDRRHLSQRGRQLHWNVRKRGRRWTATSRNAEMLIVIRPVRSFWTGRLRCKVTFFAVLHKGDHRATFPRSHLRAFELAIDTARHYLYGGQKMPREGADSTVNENGRAVSQTQVVFTSPTAQPVTAPGADGIETKVDF